jgi:hypothetical protein
LNGKLQVGSPLYEITKEALELGKRALFLETFARGDHRKLFVFYVGGDVHRRHYHQPGVCHHDRCFIHSHPEDDKEYSV